MKKLIVGVAVLLWFVSASAQVHSDSLAYETQRKKINAMLAQRESKFDQYDESLSQRTGIFGLQTKKDIRRSNEILMDITNTDNRIFKELKILLDYRAFEQQQVQTQAVQAQSSNKAFINTINQLRERNEQLLNQIRTVKDEQNKSQRTYLIVIVVLIITSILLLLTRKRGYKA